MASQFQFRHFYEDFAIDTAVQLSYNNGSGVNTVPSQDFLSFDFRNKIHTTLELRTAGDHLFSPTNLGNFRGLTSHVVPEFSDILISLAIVTDSKMTVVDSNPITIPLLQSFQHDITNSIKFTVPVVEGIYQQPLSELTSNFVTTNSNHKLTNVIHRYKIAKFYNIADLVLFFS